MRTYIVRQGSLRVLPGVILKLTEAQLAHRLGAVTQQADGHHAVVRPIQFKAGEKVHFISQPDKAIIAALLPSGEDPIPPTPLTPSRNVVIKPKKN